jgi:hypothetical protein
LPTHQCIYQCIRYDIQSSQSFTKLTAFLLSFDGLLHSATASKPPDSPFLIQLHSKKSAELLLVLSTFFLSTVIKAHPGLLSPWAKFGFSVGSGLREKAMKSDKVNQFQQHGNEVKSGLALEIGWNNFDNPQQEKI